MQCPTCKLVSQTPDVCSWCKHPLPNPHQPASAAQPGSGPALHRPQAGVHLGSPSHRPAAPIAPGAAGPPTGLPGQYTPQAGAAGLTVTPPPLAPGQHVLYGQPAGYAQAQQQVQQTPQNPYGQTMAMPTQQMPASGAMPTMQMPAQSQLPSGMTPMGGAPAITQRVSLTGEVMEVAVRPMPVLPPQLAGAGGPSLPLAAINPAFINQTLTDEEPVGVRIERFLAWSLPVLALSVLLIHFVPSAIMWVLFGDLFIMSLLLGASRAVPSYDDAIADCTGVLVITFLFGPIVALVGYSALCVARQEGNSALVAILAMSVVIPKVVGLAFASSADTIGLLALFGMFNFISFLGFFVGFLGWLISSVFRPINE